MQASSLRRSHLLISIYTRCTLDGYSNFNPVHVTVLPETFAINTACGVSGDSSRRGGVRCTDVDRPDALLPQQIRHHLDLQFRFGLASPHH
jgi:hypothetical protein